MIHVPPLPPTQNTPVQPAPPAPSLLSVLFRPRLSILDELLFVLLVLSPNVSLHGVVGLRIHEQALCKTKHSVDLG